MPGVDAAGFQQSSRPRSPAWVGYAVTILLELAITAVLIAIEPYFPLFRSQVYYVIALAAAAYWFGEGPALLSFVLGAVAVALLFVEPGHALWPITSSMKGRARLSSFLIGSAIVGVAAISARRSRFRVEALASEIRAAERRYRAIVDSAHEGIWVLGPNGRTSYINDRMTQMLGYGREEMGDRPPFDFLAPESAAPARAMWDRRLEWVREVHDLAFVRKDGSDLWAIVSMSSVSDEAGQFAYGVGMVTDITQRKEAEEALRKSEYRYAAAQRAANIGAWDWSIQTGDLTWSERIEPMFGFAPREFGRTYQAFLDCIHPNDRQFVVDAVDAAVEQGKDYAVEHRIVWPDGTVRWLSENGEVHRDENGIPIRMFGIVQDITERKQAEQEYKAIVQTAMDGFWIADANGRILDVNDAYCRLIGYTRDELLTMGVSDVEATESPEDVIRRIEGISRTGEARFETQHRHRDGRVLDVDVSINFVAEGGGRCFAFLRDITERKRADEELRASEFRLQHHVQLLQRALVPPKISATEGYTAAAVYLSALEGDEVGGDFYDSFQTEDGRMGLMIGDVSGKGIRAAALAAASRSTIRAFAYEMLSAGRSLSHTNAVLSAQQCDDGDFVTVFVMILDPASGQIDYSSAGHPPAAIWRADGHVQFLDIGNIPIGAVDKCNFESAQCTLEPGEKVVLYTDGIVEARRDSKFFDLDGVRRAIKDCGRGSADELAQGLVCAAQEWAGGRLHDDVAIVVIERAPAATLDAS